MAVFILYRHYNRRFAITLGWRAAVGVLVLLSLFTAIYMWSQQFGIRPIEFTFEPDQQAVLAQKMPEQGHWRHTIEGLRYRLLSASTMSGPGELMDVAVEVMNVTDKSFTYRSYGSPPFSGRRFYFQLNDSNATIEQDRFSGIMYPGYTVIAPGASVIVGDCKIRLPEQSGSYALSAYIHSQNRSWLLPAVELQIEETDLFDE